MSQIDEETLFKRAVRAYYRRCNDHGYIPQEPSDCAIREQQCGQGSVVILSNARGPLAVYQYKLTTSRLESLPILDVAERN